MACTDCITHQIGSSSFLRQYPQVQDGLPIAGSFELTLRCNVRCRHCYILYPGATNGELSTDQAKGVLNKLADQGVLFLLLTGGEIFARHDFREIYLHAKRLGFLLTLFSNATLIDRETADFLAEWPPRRIEVTVYGHTEQTYERVTGMKGSYQRFRRGIELLLERRLPLALKTIILRSNHHEFEDIRAWAEGLGVPFRFDTIVNPRLDGGTNVLSERIDPEAVVRFEGTTTSQRDHYRLMVQKALQSPPRRKAFSCGAGIRTFHIDPRGQIHPCMMWRSTPYDFLNGSMDGWRTHISALRERPVPEASPCGTCRHRFGCNNCAATSALENRGEPGRPVLYYCKINEARERIFSL